MSAQLQTKPAAGLDAAFRDPPSEDPSNYVFNTGANWIGGRVPDGTGTIANNKWGMVKFSSATTRLGAIELTGSLSLELAAGQTLELTDAGLNMMSAGIGCSGTIKGNVVLRSRSREQTGYLTPTWEGPVGTIEGAVVNVSGVFEVGGPNGSKSGTMTIKGSYVQGRTESLPPGHFTAGLQITADAKGISCLKVVGSANILANSHLQVPILADQAVPYGKEFPILTTTAGLKGVFPDPIAQPGFTIKLRYDTYTIYATVNRG